MDATIFYCKKCDGVFQGTQGVASICPVCNEELVETDCTMSKWDSLDESGKLSLRRQWKGLAEEQKTDSKAEQSDEPGLSDDAVVSIKAFAIIVCAAFLIFGLLWGYGFCKAYSDIKNEEGIIVMAYRISNKGMNPISKNGYKTYLHNYPNLERRVKSFSRY